MRKAPDVAFPGPFSPAFSTVDTIPLDHAEAEYQQVLRRIRQSQMGGIIVGQKATDVPDSAAQANDPEIVAGTTDSGSSYYSD
ncbi:hypothetical protein IWW55_000756 [Coemansia sp. RSA 2706]|nr:hypothetical protein IWW55_000756 [Coemansia sp. RSA 2706]KAJ2313745.1 hypothetical protein IWW54_001331 [Coemansia sp. RSA 2705]